MKVHFAVDSRTKEVIAMEVTTDDFYDSDALPAPIRNASSRRRIDEAIMGVAFDSAKSYRLLKRKWV